MEIGKGKIFRISGPVVIAEGLHAKMYELVRVGEEGLMGEVVQISRDWKIFVCRIGSWSAFTDL